MLLERDEHLQKLEALLGEAAGGSGHVVLLGGEAGAGKTSLIQALCERRAGATLWAGACDALQTPHPLAPLYDIARANDVAFRAQLAGDADRATLFDAVMAELQQSAQPVLLVVEDAHWADAATLDLLKFLGRRVERAPCLLLVSYRDDEIDAAHPLRRLAADMPARRVTRIDVPRLSAGAVAELARRSLRAPDGVYAVTQGNPFFVAELLRDGIAGVPRGVQDLVLARLARLSPAAQEIVRVVALVPARTERWLVDALLAPDIAALDECLNCGLLLAPENALSFRHELARAAVEASLSPALAQALHARLLHALEARPDAGASLARLAHHAARARDAGAVLRHAPEAARQAARRGAHKEAVAHLRSALAWAPGLADAEAARLHDALSYECYLTDQVEDAIAARESALRLWRAAGDRLREGDALRWLSRLHWYNGRSGEAERCAVAAIAVLEALAPGSELAMAYSNRAQLHMVCREASPAIAWSGKALALASALGDRDIEIHALNNSGAAKLDAGDEAGAGELERSLELALAGGCEEHAARAYTNLGSTALMARDFASARRWLDLGIGYCEARDLDSWAHYMAGVRAELWLLLGEWDRAAETAAAILQRAGVAPISRINVLGVLGRIRALRGEADEALRLLDEARELALPSGGCLRTAPIAAARAEAAWLRGDLAATAAEAAAIAEIEPASRYMRWIAGELAWWRQRAGGGGQHPPLCPEPHALQLDGRWREAAAAWGALGCRYEQARALADGDTHAQREALAAFERLGARPDAERVRRALHAAGVRNLPRGQRASTQANPHALTRRELEIVRLLCSGLKNAQIAQRLSRSVRTVDHHLEAAFAKLGVASRTEAVAAALAAGIAPANRAIAAHKPGNSAEVRARTRP